MGRAAVQARRTATLLVLDTKAAAKLTAAAAAAAAVAAAALLTAAGCGSEDTRDESFAYDLLDEQPRAEWLREVSEIRFGSSQAEPHLVRGFGPDTEVAGEAAVFSRGRESTIEFFLAWPRDLNGELDCRRVGGSAATETIDLWLNERPVGSLELALKSHKESVPRH